MSKLYFAKYISTEEKIQEGYYLISKGIAYRLLAIRDKYDDMVVTDVHITRQFTIPKDDKARLAKLFICSRLIRIGDKLKECLPDGVERTVHHFETVLPCGVYVLEPWPSEDEKWIQGNLAFKVIGEISPEATWVKEGDEFDEGEWRVTTTIFDEYVELEKTALNDPEMDKEKLRIELKGPCGHFH